MQKTHHNYATCMNFLTFPKTVKHPTYTSHISCHIFLSLSGDTATHINNFQIAISA